MAIPITVDSDNFLQWRNNTNETATSLGDLQQLDLSQIGSPGPETDVVSAVNKVAEKVSQDPIVFAIALG